MIKIPVATIISKIQEKKDLSGEEVRKKIDDKLQQLAGLISEEGAAHIIANELGVKLFDSEGEVLKIKDVYAGMRNVEVTGKVVSVFETREFQTKDGRSGKVASIIIGDETGTTRVTLWGSKTDDIKDLKEDDIVKIKSGYSREDRNKRSEIHLNDNSQLVINPKGEKIDEVKRASPIVSVRKKIVDVVAGDENIEVLGTVVQAYDPVFWEACPTCNKRIKETGDGFECADHGVIPTPDYGYVMNAFIDDGSESIRTVFFRNQLQHLIGKNHDEVVLMRNANFEEVKDDILGKIVSVVGRVTENEMFARKELVAQLVNTNPDPKDELERLSAETPETPKTTIIEDDEKVEEVAKDEVVEEETTSVEEEAPKEVVEEVLVSEEDEKVEEEVVEDLEESDENFDEETPLVEDDEIKQGVEDEVIEDDEEPLSLNDLEEVDDDDDIYS